MRHADRTLTGYRSTLDLRRGVRFHNGDGMTAEDVAFSFGPLRMFGETRPTVQGVILPLRGTMVTTARVKQLPAKAQHVARRPWPAFWPWRARRSGG